MTKKRKVDIIIDGRNFTVVGLKDEEYIKKVAKYVDGKIKDLAGKNDKLSQTMSATLAALNIADEYFTSKNALEKLEEEAKDPIKKYESVILELESARETIEKLEGECAKYKDNLVQSKLYRDNSALELEEHRKLLSERDKELAHERKAVKSLEDQVFESQIELLDTKKELKEVLLKLDNAEKAFLKEEN